MAASIRTKHWWTDKVYHLLRDKFTYTEFVGQEEAFINATLSGLDVIARMPSGMGKSLCYQLPALVKSGTTIVISPLLAVQREQVQILNRRVISAILIAGSTSKNNTKAILELTRRNKAPPIIYMTLEFLVRSSAATQLLRDLNYNGHLTRIAIDEAHLISQCGHDSRPDYLSLGFLRQCFPDVPILCVSSIPTALWEKDVATILKYYPTKLVSFSEKTMNRRNLFYEVAEKKETVADMARRIQNEFKEQSGIIYCLKKEDTVEVAQKLSERYSIPAAFYHSSIEDREDVKERWHRGEIRIIVATVAFSMGINKENVRFIFHHTMPQSLEQYYIDIGRAGRDGLPAHCVIYCSSTDFAKLKGLIVKKKEDGVSDSNSHQDDDQFARLPIRQAHEPGSLRSRYEEDAVKDRQFQAVCTRRLHKVKDYIADKEVCRRKMLLNYFGEAFESQDCENKCGACSLSNQKLIDMTDTASDLIHMIEDVRYSGFYLTRPQATACLTGSKASIHHDKRFAQLPGFGGYLKLEYKTLSSVCRKLEMVGVFEEFAEKSERGNIVLRIRMKDKSVAEQYREGQIRLFLRESEVKEIELFDAGVQKTNDVDASVVSAHASPTTTSTTSSPSRSVASDTSREDIESCQSKKRQKH